MDPDQRSLCRPGGGAGIVGSSRADGATGSQQARHGQTDRDMQRRPIFPTGSGPAFRSLVRFHDDFLSICVMFFAKLQAL